MFEDPLTSDKLSNILSLLRHGLEQLLGDQLEAVYLYGSHARGDARPDSDIDVLVVLNGEFDYFKMIESTISSLSTYRLRIIRWFRLRLHRKKNLTIK